MEQAPERVKTYEERLDELTAVIFKDIPITVIDETVPQTPHPVEVSK